MGIPYSKEIDAAFDQVTPLVAAGFEVLKKTKNIAILLACIQVFTFVLLALNLLALLGLLYTVNPQLETERELLVTPAMRWLAEWILTYGGTATWMLKVFLVLFTASFGLILWPNAIDLIDIRTPNSGNTTDAAEES